MKKFFENMHSDTKVVIWMLLAFLVIGLLICAPAWRVYNNETLPQERRQFLDL